MFVVSRSCSWSSLSTLVFSSLAHVIVAHHIWLLQFWKKKRKRQRGANKKEKKKPHQQKKTKKEKAAKKKIQKCLHPFVVSWWVVLLFAWTRSKTGLGRRHRQSWDYFSVLQFWIEILIFLATILCLPKATHILLSAQVHLATVTPKLDNWLCHLLALVRTLARRW